MSYLDASGAGPSGAGAQAHNRRRELAHNLRVVEERVAQACATAGRPRAELTLVVVTKTWPASDVRLLAELGVRDVGESRDQEARDKSAECGDLGLRWHFVGQLQRNKARSVARYAALVHTVDRPSLVAALQSARAAQPEPLHPLPVLIQVSLDRADAPGAENVVTGEPVNRGAGDAGGTEAAVDAVERGGAMPSEVPHLADLVASANALALVGVMAVAPRNADPATAFTRLQTVAAQVRREHPGATVVSAGMSGDLEAAVAAGATHLRVGSAILGSRPLLR